MAQFLLVLVVALTVGAIVFGVSVLVTGADPGLGAVEPDGRAVPLPGTRPLVEEDVQRVRFDLALRGYRMAQVDQAMRRAAYDIGYKDELIGVLEAEVEALRAGRTADADVLRRAREAALQAATATAEPGTETAPEPTPAPATAERTKPAPTAQTAEPAPAGATEPATEPVAVEAVPAQPPVDETVPAADEAADEPADKVAGEPADKTADETPAEPPAAAADEAADEAPGGSEEASAPAEVPAAEPAATGPEDRKGVDEPRDGVPAATEPSDNGGGPVAERLPEDGGEGPHGPASAAETGAPAAGGR